MTDLLAMSVDEFNQVVNDDVRADEPITGLRDPLVVDRWHQTLLSIKRKLESQFMAKRLERHEKSLVLTEDSQEWLDFLSGYSVWLRSTTRFRNGVEDKLAEAKSIKSSYERNYRQAIYDHYHSVNATENEEFDMDADAKLWNVIGL